MQWLYLLLKMAPSGLEVRGNYLFDDGQRDNAVRFPRLVLKPGAPAATGELTITYEYFSHSGDGDFFSVDSYTLKVVLIMLPSLYSNPERQHFEGSNEMETSSFN